MNTIEKRMLQELEKNYNETKKIKAEQELEEENKKQE